MASSDSEHSIAGISIPQWMKNKINDRYDLDQSTLSPPSQDDSFFYIRYPKTEASSRQLHSDGDSHGAPTYRSLHTVLENHTLPCQDFIPAAKTTPRELGMKVGSLDPPLGVAKSTGTDDGFHGIGAACGQSVVAVAHQMIAGGKLRPRLGQTHSSGSDTDDEPSTPPPLASRSLRRRGSKSLPTSPLTSPKTLRKNPYFTNVILGSSDNIAEGKEPRQGWLMSYVQESSSLRGSMADLKITENTSTEQSNQPVIVRPKQKVSKPKPSQLREMNFWSPTSM